MSENNIKRYSLDELRAKQQRGESQTDWASVEQLTAAEIEHDADEDDLALGMEAWDWDKVQLVVPEAKQPVSVRLDADILRYFRAAGPGYQTRINAVLRHYVNAKLMQEAKQQR